MFAMIEKKLMDGARMNKEMLCGWLGLPKAVWPPDAWALLGLPRGAYDLPTIEKSVQDRMAQLRCYQLSYPEEATEGMNRLAEAFVTLTEAASKPAPASPLPIAPAPAPAPAKTPAPALSKDETSVTNKTRLDWRAAPPPVRKETASLPELIAEEDARHGDVLTAKPFVAPAGPHRRAVDPALTRELAEKSAEATGNLGTLDRVIERVEQTRRLLGVWDQLGKHLRATPKKTSTKEGDAFAARLEKIALAMQSYPAFLGQPGLPGYRVVVQARLRIPLATVRAMPAEQRDDLLFDWQAAREILLTHRKYLRRVFHALRRQSAFGLFFHAVRATLNDYPRLTLAGAILLIALIVSGAIALYR
jgi:hypothetical protein